MQLEPVWQNSTKLADFTLLTVDVHNLSYLNKTFLGSSNGIRWTLQYMQICMSQGGTRLVSVTPLELLEGI